MKKINRKEVELFQIEDISYSSGTKDQLSLKLLETVVACSPNQSFFVGAKDLGDSKPLVAMAALRYRMGKDPRTKGAFIKSETVRKHGTKEIVGIRIFRIK